MNNNIKKVLNKLNMRHKEYSDEIHISARELCGRLKRTATLEELIGFVYFLRMKKNHIDLEMENIELLIDDLRKDK